MEMNPHEVLAGTPIQRLYREWVTASEQERAAYAAHPDDDDEDNPEITAASERRESIERQMLCQPCVTPEDFIAKVAAYTAHGTFGLPSESDAPKLWDEARALLGGRRLGESTIPASPKGRLAFVAKTLGVPTPRRVGPSLTDRDGGPSNAVMAFCEETGASLDSIYCGDIRGMLRGEYNRAREAAMREGEAA